MNNLYYILIILIISCSTERKRELIIESPPDYIKKHLDNFVKSEWDTVYRAKDSLMKYDKEIIPHLIGLMKIEKRFIKLKNTGDLIYPGALEFYGHGWYIPYDLDWIAIRAGWALEELTFQNFGFLENSITKIDLIQLHKDNYEEYIERGKQDVQFERESFKKLNTSIIKATNWWINNNKDWTNFTAIKEALNSKSTIRQENAISHLRYPNYKTKGLTDTLYKSELEPVILKLTKSKNEDVAFQAKLALGIKINEKQ